MPSDEWRPRRIQVSGDRDGIGRCVMYENGISRYVCPPTWARALMGEAAVEGKARCPVSYIIPWPVCAS